MIAQNDFKEKIFEAYDESEKLFQKAKSNTIVKGSDEHLDLISEIKPELKDIIAILGQVNDLIEVNFPSSSKPEAEDLKRSLHMLHSSVTMFFDALKSKQFYTESFPECINDLATEVSQLEEYIEDINNYVLSNDDAIADDLTDELHAL